MSALHTVLNILSNSWICLIMPECAKTCLNGFCLTFIHCNSLSKGTIYGFLGKWILFSIVGWVNFFVYCFRLNTFASKISDLLLPLGDWGSQGPWILLTQWYNQKIYLWCFFNDWFINFVLALFYLFWVNRDSERL